MNRCAEVVTYDPDTSNYLKLALERRATMNYVVETRAICASCLRTNINICVVRIINSVYRPEFRLWSI